EQALLAVQQNSRRYAKRQLTYLRHQIPGLIWLHGTDAATKLTSEVKAWLD
ncbi:MAG: tRNA dimethylallyltransferase, partial [Leuconostoc sp. DORA_2]